MSHQEDPHFDEVVNELRDIQLKALVPDIPEDVATLSETMEIIDKTLERSNKLEDRLKELLENGNGENAFSSYEDQIEEYLRDLDELTKTLRALRPILTPERLRDGEVGKSDVSWLSWRRNTLGSKLHKEIIELSDVLENESAENESQLEVKLKKVDQIIRTANTLQQSAQYLAWFARRVVDYNDSLSEFQRDFTVNLVTQWVTEEANKVLEHHKNCANSRVELENKLEKIRRG